MKPVAKDGLGWQGGSLWNEEGAGQSAQRESSRGPFLLPPAPLTQAPSERMSQGSQPRTGKPSSLSRFSEDRGHRDGEGPGGSVCPASVPPAPLAGAESAPQPPGERPNPSPSHASLQPQARPGLSPQAGPSVPRAACVGGASEHPSCLGAGAGLAAGAWRT